MNLCRTPPVIKMCEWGPRGFHYRGWFLFSLLVFYISDFVKEISMLHVVQCYPWFTALFKNTRTLKLKSHLHNCIFHCCQSWLRSQATMELWHKKNTQMDWNPPITNYKPWPFEPTEVNFCFLRGLLRLLMGAKTTNISCLFNFRILVFLESTVNFIFSFVSNSLSLYFTIAKNKRK